MEQKNLIPTLCHLCGLQPNKTIRDFNYLRVMQKIHNMAENFDAGVGTGFSPVHAAAAAASLAPGRLVAVDRRITVCDGMYININFVYDNLNIIILPRTAGAENVGRLWAVIARKAMESRGLHADAARPFVLLLVNTRHIDRAHTVIIPAPGEGYDDTSADNLYKAFIAAAVTDDETDFDLEIEMHGIRLKSSAARQRIKKRMKDLGVRSLCGSKATVYLRSRGKNTVDIKKLMDKYPDVYRDVLVSAGTCEYITFRLNNRNN